MIYIFTHDKEYADKIIRSLPNQMGQVFDDEARLAAAAESADGILFDLRSEPRPTRLMERLYLESPSTPIVALYPSEGPGAEEPYYDRALSWPTTPKEIAEAFEEAQNDRTAIESCGLVGRSRQLASAARIALQVAPSDVNVLITGPSGAGKEMIAKAIHDKSSNPRSPFIAVNVAALAPGIIESELFGHERGAFTGATARRIGVFEQASGGVIFLDEIGEIPLEIQAKLLRVLEQRSFTRVGGNVSIKADFRLVAATNRDLVEDVGSGHFREDLYYRLRVVSIDLPSLTERKSDIAPLAFYFLNLRKRELGSEKLEIEPGALRLFQRYNWPGNVRELKNVIDSFTITSPSGRITSSDFEKYMLENTARSPYLPVVTKRTPEAAEHQLIFQALMALTSEITSLKRLIERELERARGYEPAAGEVAPHRYESVNVEDVERELVTRALAEAHGNRKKAAELLGIGERTLYRKLDKYGLR
jgi:DNA-binding NtrC family response regulator